MATQTPVIRAAYRAMHYLRTGRPDLALKILEAVLPPSPPRPPRTVTESPKAELERFLDQWRKK